MTVERLKVEEFDTDEYLNLLNKLDSDDSRFSESMLENNRLWFNGIVDDFNEEVTLA